MSNNFLELPELLIIFGTILEIPFNLIVQKLENLVVGNDRVSLIFTNGYKELYPIWVVL